jgi:hypothetical protein
MNRLGRLAVPLASGAAYAVTASKVVLGGDSGELAAVGAAGGVAHPPGYPLFILWCRLWQWLPASPAHRVALATAISGAFAVMMLERACRAWGASARAAALAAAIFAFSPLAWRLATEPEVFMLNAAIALVLVTLAAPEPKGTPAKRAIALAFIAALGLSNHHSIVLLAPLGLLAWGRAVMRAPTRWRALTIVASLGGFAVGLLPYLYLIPSAQGACAWGDTSTFRGLVHHFLRSDYGTTRLSTSSSAPEPLGQLMLLGGSFVESLIALPLVATVVLAARNRRWSWDFAALTASLLLAGPIFVSFFNLPPRGLFTLVVARFHLLPLVLASVLGARGLEVIATRRAAFFAAAATVVLRGALSGADAVVAHRPTTERYLRNVLALLPPKSILVAAGDDLTGGFEYMQCVLGERRDVVVLAPQLMLAEWYGPRMDRALGFPIEHARVKPGETRPSLNGRHLLEELVASGRPVFLTAWFVPNLERGFFSYPIGPLVRIVPTPAEVPPPPSLLEANEAVFANMKLDDTPPPADTWAGLRYSDYARPWEVLADALDHGGATEAARECRERAARFRLGRRASSS